MALRRTNLILPAHPRGKLVLTEACPRTGSARTSTGTPHEPRGLKHRPDGAVRAVPIPPVLADLLRPHLRQFGPAPDGWLFRGARGGILSESTYDRIWRAARQIALGRQLAATPLARRPYDLRHAALSFVAERHQRARRGRRPRGHQRARAARRLRALHRRVGRPHQPADRRRPRPGLQDLTRVTMRDSKRLCAPSLPARPCPPYVRGRPERSLARPIAIRTRVPSRLPRHISVYLRKHDSIGIGATTLSAICPWPWAFSRPGARTATDIVRRRRSAASKQQVAALPRGSASPMHPVRSLRVSAGHPCPAHADGSLPGGPEGRAWRLRGRHHRGWRPPAVRSGLCQSSHHGSFG